MNGDDTIMAAARHDSPLFPIQLHGETDPANGGQVADPWAPYAGALLRAAGCATRHGFLELADPLRVL
jgi:hypothetical protein